MTKRKTKTDHLQVTKVTDPEKVVHCYFCGAKKVMTTKYKNGGTRKDGVEPTIFHKPGCRLAETKDPNGARNEYGHLKSIAEVQYPGINHGGYVTCFSL